MERGTWHHLMRPGWGLTGQRVRRSKSPDWYALPFSHED
jgi:hypothetical protein